MSRYLRPAARLAATARPTALRTSLTRPAFSLAAQRRTYAEAGGSKEYTVREALNEALAEELESNSKVFILGEEVAQYNGAYKVTKGLLDRFGEQRVIDTPITESGFCGLAVGAALSGLHPVVCSLLWRLLLSGVLQGCYTLSGVCLQLASVVWRLPPCVTVSGVEQVLTSTSASS